MTGRPTTFTQELADSICAELAEGRSLRYALTLDGMPGMSTVMRWLRESEPFREQYARAKEESADVYADEIIEIADEECTTVRADKHATRDDDGEGNTEVVFDSAAVARNRLRVDARKWVASKLKPKKYGDRTQHEHTGKMTLESLVTGAAESTPE